MREGVNIIATTADSLHRDDTFLGQPRGLAFLAFTEAWERFSYYGMSALVVLYMVQDLLLPGRIEHVAGMGAFRTGLESIFGPLSQQALASQIFGLYSGFVYFTPIIGGWLADRLLGTKRTVLLGCGLMCAGHFAMAFDASFLLALLLLVLGSGCLKGNIAAQVGHLYPEGDEGQRTRGYAIFSTGINIGAVLGPVVCGALAQVYGWHTGFATAGVLMLAASVTYLAGQRHLPDRRAGRHQRAELGPMTRPERKRTLIIAAILAMSIFQTVAYAQMFNVGLIWVDAHVDMTTPFGAIPVPWLVSLDSLSSIVFVGALIGLWRALAARGIEPSDIAKLGWGAAIAALAMVFMTIAAERAGGAKTGFLLPFCAYVLTGIAFMWYWPTMLSLVSRLAPARINAVMMASVYLTSFIGEPLAGWYGTAYESLGATKFWAINGGIACAGVVVISLFGPLLNAQLADSTLLEDA